MRHASIYQTVTKPHWILSTARQCLESGVTHTTELASSRPLDVKKPLPMIDKVLESMET
jgi:hypothetical protein